MSLLRVSVIGAMLLAAASRAPTSAAAATDPAGEGAAVLQQLVVARFGRLSRAEQLLVRGAAARDLPWAGPSAEPGDATNAPVHGDTWGPERTIRAPLLAWLCTDADAVRYIHPSGLGIAGARIDGALDFSYARLSRPLTMVHCYLPAGIDLSNAQVQALFLRASLSGPIAANLASISGDVALLYGSYGSASLFGAHVGGSLDCSGAHFVNGGGVSAIEATITGDVLFHDGFTTDRIVDLRLARIGGSLSFNDVHFVGRGDNGLNAERATVEGPLYWVGIVHNEHTRVDLENARTGALWDDQSSWPSQGNLVIEGFVYGGISGGPADAADRLRWLSLQPAGYRPQPYRQLASLLRESGDDVGSTEVLIAKETAKRRDGGLSRIERAWSLLLEVTIGYGYRPLRALWWIVGFVSFGTILFGAGYCAQIVAPSEEHAYRSFVESGAAPAHYPPFNAFVYSLDNFVPFIDLHQGLYWRPNPRHAFKPHIRLFGREIDFGKIPGSLLRWYLWLHILAGWVLTPLLFAGLSGLIRVD